MVIPILVLGALALATPALATPPAGDSTSYASYEALSRYGQGRLLEEQGKTDEALAEYFRAVTADPHALAPARRVSELYARGGDFARALEFADRALAIVPRDPRSLWLRGAALFNLGHGAEALGVLDLAATLEPDNLEYWRTLARAADHERDYERLVRACRASVDLDDGDPETWFQLAGALARRGEFAGADSALAVAREGNPSRPGLDFLSGWIEEGMGADDRAIDDYAKHLRTHPDDVATRQRRVALLAGRQRWAEAWRESQLVTRALPRDAQALASEADLAYKSGHATEGRERLRLLERLDPQDPENTAQVVSVLARNHHMSDAVSVARTWGGAHPGDLRGTLLTARAEAMAGSTDAAIDLARQAVDQAPDSVLPRLVLGRIAQQAKRWKLASETWRGLLGLRPREVPVTLDLSFCLDQQGEVDAAITAARDALSAAPTSPTVLNFLGYMLADHDRELDLAEKLVQQALAQDPDNGAYIDSMGWVYYRQRRLAEAREQLERAANLTHGDPTVLEHLGDVYRDLKMIDLARVQYRKSAAADASNQRVRNKLETIR